MNRPGQGSQRGDRRSEERNESGMIDKVVHINRVTKVVKGGKNFSFSALVVVGDGKGKVGYGSGKAKEVPAAIKKGIEIAKKNMISISMSGTTIPHAATGHYAPRKRACRHEGMARDDCQDPAFGSSGRMKWAGASEAPALGENAPEGREPRAESLGVKTWNLAA